jgi:hypothetical protein
MKKVIKKIFFIVVTFFLLIQLFQPARNEENGQVLPVHFTEIYKVPNEVKTILLNSCYDCHSNNTNYPWYSYIQPTRSLMEWHIKNGKEKLNFNTWGNYSNRQQETKLERIVKQIKADEMPLASYTLIHKNAFLSPGQKEVIINWINTINHNEL